MKKRPLTLIELMLVLTLAAVAVASLGISLPQALSEERFKKNAEAVLSKIEAATEIMLAYDTDVILTFVKQKDGIHAQFVTHKPLPSQIVKGLNKRELLSEVTDIQLDGKNCPLVFSSSNYKIPHGRLTIRGKKEVAYYLPGFPTPHLKNAYEKKKIKGCYPQTT